jgi:hypothetical protein
MTRLYRYFTLMVACACTAGIANAQSSLSSYAIGNGGGYWETLNYSLQYNIGETDVNTDASSGNVLTEGFEQSQVNITGISSVEENNNITIYPNPASTEVIIDLSNSRQKFDAAYFTDALGRRLNLPVMYSSTGVTCNISSLSNGIYLLNLIVKDSNSIYSYKVIKTQAN